METPHTPPSNTRVGFQYFPDALHYRESDLRAWVPELRSLGASWLTLVAPEDWAIPENFLTTLIAAGIEPVLHFHLSASSPLAPDSLQLIFETYARWGVHYVCLFNRPNRRRSWRARDWAQSELVERFIDTFIPLAGLAHAQGLTPVFPPLDPGGDYWDTAFLRTALESIQRRGHSDLLQNMVIGAYAWADNRPLDWGAGGPERWPGVRPYYTPSGEQDQRGFRIFDWYLPVAEAALGYTPHLLLLGMGCNPGDRSDPLLPAIDNTAHAERNLTIARLLMGDEEITETDGRQGFEPIPEQVLAGNFWLLAAGEDSPHLAHAWFKPGTDTLPVVGALRQWVAQHGNQATPPMAEAQTTLESDGTHTIANYVLLPAYEWGVADWHLDVIRPYVKRYRPTVGFSIEEASHAQRVVVIGGPQTFPEEMVEGLRAAGCAVDRIAGDGTSIASQLAEM